MRSGSKRRLRWGRIIACVVALLVIIGVIVGVVCCSASKKDGAEGSGSDSENLGNSLDVSDKSSSAEETTTAAFERAVGTIYDGAPSAPYEDIEYVCNYPELNPTTSGYEELDTLVSDFIEEHCTGDTQYERLWSGYLYMVLNFSYSATVGDDPGAYSASDSETTPTEVLWACDIFNSGMGNCKNFAAACVYYMRALGYDCYMMTGYVPAAEGGVTDHGWCVCYIGGEKFIFDTQLDNTYYNREKANGDDDPPTQINFCQPYVNVESFYTEDGIYF